MKRQFIFLYVLFSTIIYLHEVYPGEDALTCQRDTSFEYFLSLFEGSGKSISVELAQQFLSGIEEIRVYNDFHNAGGSPEMDITLITAGIAGKVEHYIALFVELSEMEPGHIYESTFFITFTYSGEMIDYIEFASGASGDYYSTETNGQLVNDSTIYKEYIEYVSDLEYTEEGMPPEFVTDIDTLGIELYYVRQDGIIELTEDEIFYESE